MDAGCGCNQLVHLCVSVLLESLERIQADIFFKFVDINTFVQFR